MSSSSPFGPTFRKIREARGLSLKEVAADIVSPQFLSQFERSQKGVTIETFSRLLLSMGVDWDTFLSHYPGLTIQNFSSRGKQRALATLFALARNQCQ